MIVTAQLGYSLKFHSDQPRKLEISLAAILILNAGRATINGIIISDRKHWIASRNDLEQIMSESSEGEVLIKITNATLLQNDFVSAIYCRRQVVMIELPDVLLVTLVDAKYRVPLVLWEPWQVQCILSNLAQELGYESAVPTRKPFFFHADQREENSVELAKFYFSEVRPAFDPADFSPADEVENLDE